MLSALVSAIVSCVAVNPRATDAELIVPMCGQISRGTGHNCPGSSVQLAVAKVVDETSDLSVYEKNMNLLYDALVRLGVALLRERAIGFGLLAQRLRGEAALGIELRGILAGPLLLLVARLVAFLELLRIDQARLQQLVLQGITHVSAPCCRCQIGRQRPPRSRAS